MSASNAHTSSVVHSEQPASSCPSLLIRRCNTKKEMDMAGAAMTAGATAGAAGAETGPFDILIAGGAALVVGGAVWWEMRNASSEQDQAAQNTASEELTKTDNPSSDTTDQPSETTPSPREQAAKRGSELVKEYKNEGVGQDAGRSGGHGTPFKRAGAQLIRDANRLSKDDPMQDALKTEGKRLIRRGRSIDHRG